MKFSDPTQQEIREEQKAYLKGKGFKYKFDYFVEYYLKGLLIILVFVIIIISAAVSIIRNKDTACQVIFVNAMNAPDEDEFAEYLGIDTDEYQVVLDTGYIISTSSADNTSYVNLQKLAANMAAKDVEVLLGDYDTIYGYAASDFYADLRNYFTDEELEALGDRVVYYDYMDEDGNLTGESAPLFIDVTDAPKLVENNCFVCDRVLLGFASNTQRPEAAMAFYNYIYE